MVKSIVLDTEEFIAWIGGSAIPRPSHRSVVAIKNELLLKFCAIVSSDQENYKDNYGVVIVVNELKIRDFFAFVSTYVSDYVPFSAFFRVISADQIDLLAESPPPLNRLESTRRVNAFVGVAIAEAALYLRVRGSNDDGRSITLPAVNATYSAAVLQGLVLGASSDISMIGRSWTSLRSLLGGDQLPLDPEKLGRFWEIIWLVVYGDGSSHQLSDELVITRTLRQVAEGGRIDDNTLAELLAAVPELNGKLSRFRGPREDRARAVQEAIAIISNTAQNEGQMRDCVAGCLLSLLGDGSFKFLPSALSLVSALPMAAVWFAAWSGLLKSNDVMTMFHCLGRRVARDLASPERIHSVPVDDISIGELRAIGVDLGAVTRSQASSISVEIYPNVSSRQALPRSIAVASVRKPDFQQELRDLRHLFAQSSAILARMDGGASQETESRLYRGSTKSRPSAKRK